MLCWVDKVEPIQLMQLWPSLEIGRDK